MKEGGVGRALIFAIASPSVAAGFGFAACLNPRCVSLICTKVSSPFVVSAADALPINPTLRGTPPLIAHTTPVPAQAMHFNRPRRFTPGLVVVSLLECLFMLFLLCRICPTGVETAGASGLFTAAEKIFDQPRGSAICLPRIAHNSVREPVEAASTMAVRASGPGEKPG